MITISNLAHSNIQSKVLSRAKVIRLHNDEHDDEGLIEDSWKVPYFNSELLQAYAQLDAEQHYESSLSLQGS